MKTTITELTKKVDNWQELFYLLCRASNKNATVHFTYIDKDMEITDHVEYDATNTIVCVEPFNMQNPMIIITTRSTKDIIWQGYYQDVSYFNSKYDKELE